MLRSPLHIPFFGWVMKSFAVSVGSMEQSFDISLKDNSFDMVIATFHKNDALLGNYQTNYQLLKRHDIIQSYLTGPIGIRIPSLPAAELSDIQGYNFLDADHSEMSYYVFLDSLGLFRTEGLPISQTTWLESQFMLPFKTTFETDRFSR